MSDFVVSETLQTKHCPVCHLIYAAPKSFWQHKAALHAAKAENQGWWCPNGHYLVFSAESELDAVRRERDRAKLDLARAWAKADEVLKRVHKGICPCCNRSFQNLARHMKTKHPQQL